METIIFAFVGTFLFGLVMGVLLAMGVYRRFYAPVDDMETHQDDTTRPEIDELDDYKY